MQMSMHRRAQIFCFSLINSLSSGSLKPGHQCPCLKSLIARLNFPWKNIKTAHFEAKRKLYHYACVNSGLVVSKFCDSVQNKNVRFLDVFIRQNLFKSIISIAENLSLQPPSIFCVRGFYNNIYHLSNFREISPKNIEDMRT